MKSELSKHANRVSLAGSCIIWMALLTAAALLVRPPSARAQNTTFTSGSDGSDGAYAPTTSGYFDPVALGLHGSQDKLCVFNFTTITIPKGVTIKLSANKLNCPIYWLASGDVDIEGTLDLSGANGGGPATDVDVRIPATPGSGGYSGGVGGNTSTSQTPTAGNGPGGGPANVNNQANCSWEGSFTGNQYLVPLFGGSGGGGQYTGSEFGGGGGAGGGAILVASSTQITVNGTINANGGVSGNSQYAGNGSGGAIRLVSNAVAGSGTITANGPNVSCGGSNDTGRVRVEASTISFNGTFNGSAVSESNPLELLLPSVPLSSVLVTSVNGTPITENPFSFPDITINTTSAVPVVITAHQVPVGTVPTLYIFSEKADQALPCTGGLQGTLATSTCTVSITYPYGGSRGFVKATWTQ